MTAPDRWSRVETLLHAARERRGAERAAFLDAACGDDAEMRREVESLLAQPTSAGECIDQSALAAAGQTVTGPSGSELLLKAQTGDADALARLVASYSSHLQRWVSRRVPWVLLATLDTAELVRDAIAQALPHADELQIQSEDALQFYLQQALKARVIALHQGAGYRAGRGEASQDLGPPGILPQYAAIGFDALGRYERALASLTKQERDAIVFRVEFWLDYEEIAAHLGRAGADAARTAVSRALVRLADKMSGPEGQAGHGL